MNVLIKKDLKKLKDPARAKLLSGFFKTGKGQYGEGDTFLGITVPKQREVAKKYSSASLKDIKGLLKTNIHEYRFTALLMLVHKFKISNEQEKKKIVDFYLKHTLFVNNWDLVDLTANRILGYYLLDKDRSILYKLARSRNLWERRISIISTFAFIDQGKFNDSLKIGEILLNDKHDLIHKAVGWVLREVGKKDQKAEEKFLKKHYKQMPRTMLRYAIEKFDEKKRRFYLER